MRVPRKWMDGKIFYSWPSLFRLRCEFGGEHLVLLEEVLLGHELGLSSFVAESVAARCFFETLQQSFETLARAAARAVRIDEILDLFNQFVECFEAQVCRVTAGVFHMDEFSFGSGALDKLIDDGQA